MLEKDYLKKIVSRKKQTHVFKDFQHTGLVISEMLEDKKNKSLYIKLAKTISKQILIPIAKDVSERKNVASKGAYFMKLIKEKGIFNNIISKKIWLKKKKNEMK